ncbi:MAG: sulfate ABC transporter permease subunit CysT [Vulcanimicrobiaceae bacterium]
MTTVGKSELIWREPSAIPGKGLTLGCAVLYLSLVILIPLAAIVLRPWSNGLDGFIAILTSPRVLAALELSYGTAAIAALINTFFGLIVAWTLTRYRFLLRRVVDSVIDLPFPLPTSVAGIALSALYAHTGWLGAPLAAVGIKVAYTRLGILVALVFIGLPFVVRTIEPVLADMSLEAEEAAATLGATRYQTLFRVVLPALAPALVTGSTLAFARAVGEYGSVIFIAGNLPMVSEIAPLLIVIKLQEFDYAGASAIGVIMLFTSLSILFALNALHRRLARR